MPHSPDHIQPQWVWLDSDTCINHTLSIVLPIHYILRPTWLSNYIVLQRPGQCTMGLFALNIFNAYTSLLSWMLPRIFVCNPLLCIMYHQFSLYVFTFVFVSFHLQYILLMLENTSALFPSQHLSSSGEDQQGLKFHIEPIKLTGSCCAGTSICLRSHYEQSSLSWKGPPHHYSVPAVIPRSLIWHSSEPAHLDWKALLRLLLPMTQRWWMLFFFYWWCKKVVQG